MTLAEFRRVYPTATFTVSSGKLFTYRYYQNPQAKGQHGKGVLHRHPPLPLGQGHAAQQDISCLGVGKDLPSKEIGISVHQPSRQCQ